MAIEQMKMPQLGESVTEGTISKWLVSPGDHVNKYDPIAEVMTDKVNAEVPSSFTGTITKLSAEEGETLQVGEVFCEIEVEGSEQQSAKEEAPKQSEAPEADQTNENQSQKKRYSPAVLRLADEHGIDLAAVQGTGAGGRITRKDLLQLIENGGVKEKTAPVNERAVQPEACAVISSKSGCLPSLPCLVMLSCQSRRSVRQLRPIC